MNTTTQQNNGAGNWIAFLFGAIFNVMTSVNQAHIVEQSIIALIGGVIWLTCHIILNKLTNKGLKPRVKPSVKSNVKLNRNNHAKD